jgi:hypothetical protein
MKITLRGHRMVELFIAFARTFIKNQKGNYQWNNPYQPDQQQELKDCKRICRAAAQQV